MLATAIVLACLALFGWLGWWWIFLPNVHVLGLHLAQQDLLAVPPVPYGSSHLERLSDLSPGHPARVLEGLHTADSMASLGGAIQAEVRRPRDTLILYINGHGIAQDGKAYLVCSDFLREAGGGRFPVAALLEQLADCPARLKLMILDSGSLPEDPRLGMIANPWPGLLEEAVRGVDDPGLWVLASHGDLEVSHLCHGRRASVFSTAVFDGLSGHADLNGDDEVDLAELHEYVGARVSDWVRRCGLEGQSQTPRLLHGSEGAVEPSPVAVVPTGKRSLRRRTAEAAAEDETKDDEEAAAARAELRQVLQEAWALRDRSAGRATADGWSPVDYAPHLWRELEAMILGYELQFRFGPPDEARRWSEQARSQILPWGEYLDTGRLPSGMSPSSVVSRLARAHRRFVEGPVHEGFSKASREFDLLKRAICLKNDLAALAPYCVRWHARASLGPRQGPALGERISRLVSTDLPALFSALEALQGPGRGGRPVLSLPANRRALESQIRAMERLRKEIEEDGLRRLARSLAGRATGSGRGEAVAQTADVLLRTPLLPAPERLALIDLIEALEAPAENPSAPEARRAGSGSGAAAWRWERLADQAELEIGLVRLVDEAQADALKTHLERFRTAARDSVSDEAWTAARKLGGGLGLFYQGLPAAVGAGLRTSGRDELRAADRMLRLIDARDVAHVGDEFARAVLPVPALPQEPVELARLTCPEKVTVNRDAWTDFELSLQGTGEADARAALELRFDPSLVELATRDGESVRPGVSRDVVVRSGRAVAHPYRIRARGEEPLETEVQATVTCETSRHTASMGVVLPPPDRVDLVVSRVDGRPEPGVGAALGADHLRVRPFPNRANEYQLSLVNRSGRARQVVVRLHAADGSDRAHSGRRTPDLLPKLGESVPIDLSADDTPAPVRFPAPKPEVPESKSRPGEAASPEQAKPGIVTAKPVSPEPPQPESFPPLTNGIVCVVEDTAERDSRWVRRLTFSPRLPRDYLEAEAGYDPARGRIEIRLRARDRDGQPNLEGLPVLTSEEPIEVAWDTAGILAAETRMKQRAVLGPPGYQALLFADVPPDPARMIPVRLAVDGYPRAFVFHVRCDRRRERIPRERSLSRVRIAAPQDGDALRAPAEEIVVKLQVDAPEDAFRQPGDRVEVGLDENGDRFLRGEPSLRLSADRQVIAELNEVSPEGILRVTPKVGDFVLRLVPAGLRNTTVDVLAQLHLSATNPLAEEAAAEDAATVVLDAAPPVLRVEVSDREHAAGEPVRVTAEVEDLSGAAEVRFGFDVDESGALEEDEKPVSLRRADAEGKWIAEVPTKDLPPGRHVLLVRAIDRVGLQGQPVKNVVAIASDSAMAKPKKPTTGSIEGRVILIDRPAGGIKVTIEGLGRTATSDSSGRFSFESVPPGSYTLQAKGVALNQRRSGKAGLVVEASTKPTRVEVQIE